MQRVRRCGQVFDGSSERGGFFEPRAGGTKIAFGPRQHAISEQRACAGRCRSVITFDGGREKGPSLTPVAPMEPEPKQGAREPRRVVLYSLARVRSNTIRRLECSRSSTASQVCRADVLMLGAIPSASRR